MPVAGNRIGRRRPVSHSLRLIPAGAGGARANAASTPGKAALRLRFLPHRARAE